LVETVGTERSDGIAAAAAAVVGQSIKTAEAMTRLDRSAGRLISRLCIGLYRTRLSIKALSVALHRALRRQTLRPHSSASDCASDCASGCASVALHCIVCAYGYVRVCVRGCVRACKPALTAGRRLSNWSATTCCS
jgi:hypothetical protein